MPRSTAYVFFLTEWRWWDGLPRRTRIRVLRQVPQLAPAFIRARICRLVTGSELVHTAVGDGAGVISASVKRETIQRFDRFWVNEPAADWCFEVPCPHFPQLRHHALRTRLRFCRTFLSWWTLGLIRGDDCTASVCRLLREGGLNVPRRIHRPCQLFDWLRSEGYRLVSTTGTEAA